MSLEPCLLVTYHGLAGSGVALVAYNDGMVILEEETPAVSSCGGRGPRRHRQERFAGLARAREALGLPLRLPAGELLLRTDTHQCCPCYQVFRFLPGPPEGRPRDVEAAAGADPEPDPEPAAAGSAVLTRVRFGFGPDDPAFAPDSNDFRAFRERVASYEQSLSRTARPLLARLGLTEETLDVVLDAAKGLDSLDEKLEMMGLAERFADRNDTAWPAEVRKASAQIRAKIGEGQTLKAALLEVLFQQPSGGEWPVANLSGWEAVVGPAAAKAASPDALASLRAWLLARRPAAPAAGTADEGLSEREWLSI